MKTHHPSRSVAGARRACLGLLLAAGASLPSQAQDIPKLFALWDFNDPAVSTSTADKLRGFPGQLVGAVYSADAEGRTGAAGDYAMDLGQAAGDGQYVLVNNANWLNFAGAADTMTVVYWQKLSAVAASSAYWMVSPSSSGNFRGNQVHSTWSDGTIYFDTAGCCGGPQRLNISAGGADLTTWHHFALLKRGEHKEIWMDGVKLAESDSAAPLPTDFTQFLMGAEVGGANSMRGWLDDFAVFGSGLNEADIVALASGSISPDALSPDTDGDGVPDWYEDENGLNKAVADGNLDADADGLNNLQEYLAFTAANNPDTDGDGAKDGAETGTGVFVDANNTGTNRLNPDTDGDGVQDGAETGTGTYVSASNTGSNPLLKDSDGDTFPDGAEVQLGSDPTKSSATPIKVDNVNLLAYWDFNDASVAGSTADKAHGLVANLTGNADFSADSAGRTGAAGDRALDLVTLGGTLARAEAPGQFASAAGVGDAITISYWQSLSETPDTMSAWLNSPSSGGGRGAATHNPWSNRNIYWDTAGCCDAATQRINQAVDAEFDFSVWHHYVFVKRGSKKQIWIDGVLFLEGNSTAKLPVDFDRAYIGGGPGFNSARGLIDDFAIFAKALDPAEIAALASGALLPTQLSADTDGDGMSDLWENAFGLNLNSPADASNDPDSDGATNLQEFRAGTDPKNPDSDGDGLQDGVETGTGIWVSNSNRGTSPNSVDSDADGLGDAVETNTGVFLDNTNPGTNPNKADTDGDRFNDGLEITLGFSPVSADSAPLKVGKVNLMAHWDFNDPSAADLATDRIQGLTGTLESGVVYTEDAAGHTGQSGDYAVDFGADGGSQKIRVDGVWAQPLGALNQVTVAYWQQLTTVGSSFGFWFQSPISGGGRGISGHTPWSDRTLYFDTAGCCGGDQRINKTASAEFDFLTWHHYAFVKDGSVKRIYIDGELFLEGTGTLPLPGDYTEVIIGNSTTTPATRGKLDDFMVFGSPLSTAQIAGLVAGTIPTDDVSTTELFSSASVNGPFAKEASATVDPAAKTISVAVSGSARFYRVSSESAVTIKGITVQGNTVTITY
ncbi:MAG: hypothetical protein JNN07_16585 [Verrucomicrobiales bacterium]|nr:hypothetical protein [Verrucomicrobiales bacterium]